jgi:hypothetical protein
MMKINQLEVDERTEVLTKTLLGKAKSLWYQKGMSSSARFYQVFFSLLILAAFTQFQCLAGEKSKYYGAKLVELDALMRGQNSYGGSCTLGVFNGMQPVGFIGIRKFKTASTAVEIATQHSQGYQLLSKPTSGWFTNNDSAFEAISSDSSNHYYVRVMKSDGECYIMHGSMSEDYWKANGGSLRSLIDSFKFN